MSVELIYYPRGFVGYGIPSNLNVGPNINEVISAAKSGAKLDTEPKFPPSEIIKDLWSEFCIKRGTYNSFEFRERILKAAFLLFKVPNSLSFEAWLNEQKQSKYVSAPHKRFLADTIKFITTGERSVEIYDWFRFVHLTTTDKNIELTRSSTSPSSNISNVLQTAIDEINNNEFMSFIMTDVLHRWVSTDNGFDDLLRTMVIVFGPTEGE